LHFPQYLTGHFQNRTRNDANAPIGAVSNSHSTNQQRCFGHLYLPDLIGTVDGDVEINTRVPFVGFGNSGAFDDNSVTFLQLLKSGGV